MSARRKLALAAFVVVLGLATVAVVALWVDILSSPLGRSNAAAMLHPLGVILLAAWVLGDAIKKLPASVRPERPYRFALGVLLAFGLVAAQVVSG